MSDTKLTWKKVLGERLPAHVAEEIDVFEAQIAGEA
jgi:hypothetical protein